MPFFIKSFLAILLLFTFKPSPQDNISDWKLVNESENIKIYTRLGEDSKIKKVKIEAVFNVDFEQLIFAINDVENYPLWIYKSYDAKMIKRINKNEFYYHLKTDFPFPLNDRDLEAHSKQWHDKEAGIFEAHSKASTKYVDVDPAIVRIENYEVVWKIVKNKDGSIKIDYNVSADPSGYIPAWVINLAVAKGPMETMMKLEKLVASRS